MVRLRGTRYKLRARLVDSAGIELLGGLAASVIVPTAIGIILFDKFLAYQLVENSIVACSVSFALATIMVRTMSGFPDTNANAYAPSIFVVVYAAMVVVMLLLRAQYSRYLIGSGFVIALTWNYIVVTIRAKSHLFNMGLVDFGETKDIDNINSVAWHRITYPSEVSPDLDVLVADLHADLPTEWEAAIAEFVLKGIPVYHVKYVKESLTGKVELEHMSENSFGSLTPTLAYFQVKRALDWMAAAVMLVPMMVPMIIIAAAIKFSSPGPAIFRQKRVGYRGKPFTVFKFRTMHFATNVEDALSAAQTKESDSRITSLGRFLRASRLDELPQLFNILKGEMSWIGPRPEAEVLSKWYESEIPFYRYRHVVVPGITGWAQVCQGHVVDVSDVTDKLHYDFYYIKHFSAAIDLLIVFRTISTMFTGRGHR